MKLFGLIIGLIISLILAVSVHWILGILSLIIVIFIFTRPKKAIKEKDISVRFKVSSSTEEAEEEKPSEFYTVKEMPNGDFVINHKSCFELNIYNINKEEVLKLIEILDETYNKGTYERIEALTDLLMHCDIKCREIDDYLNEFKPKYDKLVNEFIECNSEWKTASEKDKKDILAEANKRAIEKLGIRPNVNLDILFNYQPKKEIEIRNLLKLFPSKVIKKYVQFWSKDYKVRTIPVDNYNRKFYEELVKHNLAVRGDKISSEKILILLKMDELKQIALKYDVQIPNKKQDAVKILSEIPEIKEELKQKLGFRQLFQLVPLPEEFKNIQVEDIKNFIDYLKIITDLIGRTYSFAFITDRTINEYKKRGFISGYEIISGEDENTCYFCRMQNGKKYKLSDKIIPPLHLACRCTLTPILD